jgi:hypothetical protein
MTFGRWGFAATTRRANEPGYPAYFVVSAVPAGSIVNSVSAEGEGGQRRSTASVMTIKTVQNHTDRGAFGLARPDRRAPPGLPKATRTDPNDPGVQSLIDELSLPLVRGSENCVRTPTSDPRWASATCAIGS